VTVYKFPERGSGSPNPEALSRVGMLLDVDVQVVAPLEALMRRRGERVESFRGLAIVDTGASMTSVHSSIIAGFDLIPMNKVFVDTLRGRSLIDTYAVRLAFPSLDGWEVERVEVLSGQHALSVIMGRDILRHCRLDWDGSAGQWSLDIPATNIRIESPPEW